MEPVNGKVSRFLIDTHVLLWWLFDDPKLSGRAHDVIQAPANTILVSSASGWEVATKYRLGKLPHAGEAARNLPARFTNYHGSCANSRSAPRTSS
jgi:PIN domain nuclease of toxin-antitoxin system